MTEQNDQLSSHLLLYWKIMVIWRGMVIGAAILGLLGLVFTLIGLIIGVIFKFLFGFYKQGVNPEET
jgi:hypothetical protein